MLDIQAEAGLKPLSLGTTLGMYSCVTIPYARAGHVSKLAASPLQRSLTTSSRTEATRRCFGIGPTDNRCANRAMTASQRQRMAALAECN